MTGGKNRGNPPDLNARLERAQRALEDAQAEGEEVDRKTSFFDTLREGWKRVHEENHLAGLFSREYGSTR